MRVTDADAASIIGRRFSNQPGRPRRLEEVTLASLSPSERALIVADGTVTVLLEGIAMERVHVQERDYCRIVASDDVSNSLVVASNNLLIRRRVIHVGVATGRCLAAAESWIVPDRLPAAFIAAVGAAKGGIGEAVVGLGLHLARDLLWFGLDERRPDWIEDSGGDFRLTWGYLLMSKMAPLILIQEWFPGYEMLS